MTLDKIFGLYTLGFLLVTILIGIAELVFGLPSQWIGWIFMALSLGIYVFIGIITRTVRALVSDVLSKEFVTALVAKGLRQGAVFFHVVKNVAPTALAVMGVQLGYLMGGSILVETVFSWPGTGFLLNTAIFQRDIPLLQGTILVLAMFFVALNLIVDIVQTGLDPRIRRA